MPLVYFHIQKVIHSKQMSVSHHSLPQTQISRLQHRKVWTASIKSPGVLGVMARTLTVFYSTEGKTQLVLVR